MKKYLIFILFLTMIIISSKGLTLDEGIVIALENNLNIKISELDEQLAKYDHLKSITNFVPTFNIQLTRMEQDLKTNYEALFGPVASQMGLAKEVHNIDLNLTVPIFTASTRFLNFMLTKRTLGIQRKKQKIENASIIFQTKVHFYTCLFLKNRIEIEKESMRITNDEYEIMQKQFQSGEIPKPLVTAQKINLERIKNRIDQIENDYNVAKEKFKRFLMIEDNIEPTGEFSEIIYDYDKEEMVKEVSQGVDIQLYEEQIRVLKNVRSLTLAPLLPSLIFTWNVNHRTGEFSWTSSDWNRTDRSMFILNIPILPTSVWWDHKKAKANIEKAQIALEILRNSLETELISSLMDLENIRSTIDLVKNTFIQAQENYDMTKTAYEAGEMGYLDLEKAQLLLNETRLFYLSVLMQKEINQAKIQFIIKEQI